jgi:hypothetical protein
MLVPFHRQNMTRKRIAAPKNAKMQYGRVWKHARDAGHEKNHVHRMLGILALPVPVLYSRTKKEGVVTVVSDCGGVTITSDAASLGLALDLTMDWACPYFLASEQLSLVGKITRGLERGMLVLDLLVEYETRWPSQHLC